MVARRPISGWRLVSADFGGPAHPGDHCATRNLCPEERDLVDSRNHCFGFAFVTAFPETWILLVLAAFCASGWMIANKRLAAVRRHAQTREQSYRVVEKRMSLAEQATGFGIWEWDPSTDLFTLSAGAAALNGLGDCSMRVNASQLYATVHPDDCDPAKAARQQALVDGGVYEIEFRRVLPDGSVRWYRNYGYVEAPRNVPPLVVGAVRDITSERAVLEASHQSAERMQLAEKAASFGIWEMDLASGMVKGSEAWAVARDVCRMQTPAGTWTRCARSYIRTTAGCSPQGRIGHSPQVSPTRSNFVSSRRPARSGGVEAQLRFSSSTESLRA